MGPLRLKKLWSSSPKDAFSAKFSWNWPNGFREEDFLNCYYLPLKKGWALYLNKLESPSPKDALCQFWLKLAKRFWRIKWKCEKFTQANDDDDNDDNDRHRQIFISKAHLSLWLKWAKKEDLLKFLLSFRLYITSTCFSSVPRRASLIWRTEYVLVEAQCRNSHRHDFCMTSARENPVRSQNPSLQKMMG